MLEMTRLEILKLARESLYERAELEATSYINSCWRERDKKVKFLSEFHEKINWLDAEIKKEREDDEEVDE